MSTGKRIAPDCQRSGAGKGTCGKSVDRCKRICAAGVPTAQGEIDMKSSLPQYLLQDEVAALLSDAIIPPPPPKNLAPLRHPVIPDQRHRHFNSEAANLVTPPKQVYLQALVNDLKETNYNSYWRKPVGKVPDPIPMFPKGFDIENTTYGKKYPKEDSLYELVMPKNPLPDTTPKSKEPGVQTDRSYCKPFNADFTFGKKTNVDKRGKYVKCIMNYPKVLDGTSHYSAISVIQEGRQNSKNNMNSVFEGFSSGINEQTGSGQVLESLISCKINPNLPFFRMCLSHLNSLRIIMSKRVLPSFFPKLYLRLKFEDKEESGWIPKTIVYNNCAAHLIRFDPSLMEPLLCLWEAFDGSKIKYEIFCRIINFKMTLPALPKVPDIHPDDLDYRTTYQEMVKPGQPCDERPMAAVPSGRYIDLDYPRTPKNYFPADNSYLPDESDMKSNLYPSIFTLCHVNHRDMFARREPEVVRRVFEAAGEEFTDEKFNQVWEEAMKHHSQGWVCYETFRRALTQLYPECIM